MGDYDINQADVVEAARVLRDVLAARNPNLDYSEGSMLGDTVVDGHAAVYAILRNQLLTVKSRLSLRDLSTLVDSQSVQDAADGILSNIFRARAQGGFAKGVLTLHFTQPADIRVPRTTRFFWDAQRVFYLDSGTDLIIPSSALLPNVGADGTVADYVYQVAMSSARKSESYNVNPQRWLAVDPFSPFFSYAESTTPFQFGTSKQATQDYITSAQNAMSVRALINPRSNDSLLRGDLFPQIQNLLTVNYGDPEMHRDVASDPASGVSLHVGGAVDIYVWLATQVSNLALTVGERTPRADGIVTIFRDSSSPFANVVPGDVLVVGTPSALPEAPFQFVVTKVNSTSELEVSARVPFTTATDELPGTISTTYSIGNNYPVFNNHVSATTNTTAATSRSFSVANAVILPGAPLYRVKQVSLATFPVALTPYQNALTGTVVFTQQQNTPLTAPARFNSSLAFRVVVVNPTQGQSAQAVQYIELGWPGLDLTGYQAVVTYETVAQFDPIDTYVSDNFNRTSGANPLVKAYHPIYLSLSMPYRPRVSGQAIYSVNETTAARALVANINATPFGQNVDVGTLGSAAKSADGNIAATYNFTIKYSLLAPNGQVYQFETDDIVTVFPDGVLSSARLINPTDFGLDPAGYYPQLKNQLLRLGVSDRTIRYLASTDTVTLLRRG